MPVPPLKRIFDQVLSFLEAIPPFLLPIYIYFCLLCHPVFYRSRYCPKRPIHKMDSELWKQIHKFTVTRWDELKAMNIILLPMNFAIFHIPGIGSNSIVCGLNAVCFVCLLWGVIYRFCVSIYFVDHDEEEYNEYWGKEANGANGMTWWDIWILFSMPSVWTIWGVILFALIILVAIWQPSLVVEGNPVPLFVQILSTALFVVGVIYMVKIVLKMRDGERNILDRIFRDNPAP